MFRLGGDDAGMKDLSSSKVLTVPTVPKSSGVFLVVLILRQKNRIETNIVTTATFTSNDINVTGSISVGFEEQK